MRLSPSFLHFYEQPCAIHPKGLVQAIIEGKESRGEYVAHPDCPDHADARLYPVYHTTEWLTTDEACEAKSVNARMELDQQAAHDMAAAFASTKMLGPQADRFGEMFPCRSSRAASPRVLRAGAHSKIAGVTQGVSMIRAQIHKLLLVDHEALPSSSSCHPCQATRIRNRLLRQW